MPSRRVPILFILLFQFISQLSFSQPSVKVSPTPKWLVAVTPGGKAPSSKDYSDGYYVSFSDLQVNLEKKSTYLRLIRNIESESGIQNGSEISVAFDPTYERLEFHSLIVWRGGRPISRLNPSDFKVAPLEADRQRFIYNGDYQASLVLKDIRKGDKIEYSFSRTGWNPVFENKYSGVFSFGVYDYMSHIHVALISPSGRTPSFKDFNKPPKRTQKVINGQQVFEWDLKDIKHKADEDFLPSWYTKSPFVQVSEFRNWEDVVNWGLRVYQPSVISGKLKEKIDQWKKQADGSRWAYLQLATRFVQDEIRYLGIETGENSHRPHNPMEVFDQRYGDCKDKTFLLCAILRANNIEAYPTLVDTDKTGHLWEYLPSPLDFNHVVLKVKIEEKRDIFVDATYSLQGGGAGKLYFPPYRQGLVLAPGQKAVSAINDQNNGNIIIEEEFTLPAVTDTSGTGYLTVKSVYFDSESDRLRNIFQEGNLSETEESYLNFYRDNYKKSDFELVDSLEYYDQRDANNFSIIERYKVKNPWVYDSTRNGYYFVSVGRIMYDQMINLPNRKRVAPVSLPYPYHLNYTIKIKTSYRPSVPIDDWEIKRDAYVLHFASSFDDVENVWILKYDYQTLQDFVAADQVNQYKSDVEKFSKNLEYELPYGNTDSLILSSPNYAMIFLFLFSLTVGGIFCRKFYQYYPDNLHAGGEGDSIGGWLILIGLNIIGSPLAVLYTVVSKGYLNLSTWKTGSDGFQSIYHIFITAETFINGLLISGGILVGILFFKKRSTFPQAFAIYYGFNILVNLTDILLAELLLGDELSMDLTSQMGVTGRMIIFSAIWVAYLYKSERAKRTFVKGYVEGKLTLETSSVNDFQSFENDQE